MVEQQRQLRLGAVRPHRLQIGQFCSSSAIHMIETREILARHEPCAPMRDVDPLRVATAAARGSGG
jgi:hypothetical protein